MTSWKTWIAPLLLAVSLSACGPTRQDVENEIAQANHCDVPQDCALVGSYCPFGCHVLSHASEATRIREEIEAYYDAHPGEQCLYDCLAISGIDCVGGRCEVLLANP